MSEHPNTCVIGAGVSGLTAVKALGDRQIPHTCFDASDDIGGNWYFQNPNGRSSAYRSLHIDTSKNAISFQDFPMGQRYPDFPHHSEIKQFLGEYADHFGLRDRIRFNTRVEHAERLEDGGWRISVSGPEGEGEERFDVLLVCNGHHWDPSYPDFPGQFDGETIHSHHYIDPKDPVDLTGKRVLVVGIGNSAVDITSELARKGVAEQVFISTRSGAWVVPKYVFGRPADQVFKTNPRLPLGLQRRFARLLPRLVS
ncbi:MAG TPA: NAD(P)-binding domain-containing protein, partial [Solirubrobacteraceae bacterium]|nr:NAD(P)-binding domain-containing protein [Solirubrobacteraceae bacterium]